MGDISRTEDTNNQDIDIRATNLIRESKVLTLGRLAKMVVDLFGADEPLKKLVKELVKKLKYILKT